MTAAPAITLLDGLQAVPPRVARRHALVPLRYEDGDTLVVGARDPESLQAVDALRRLGHERVTLEPIDERRYVEVMDHWYGPMGDWAEYVAELERSTHGQGASDPRLEEDLQASPAPRFLELTLRVALAEGASDVHVEPDPHAPRIRFRIDGVLVDRIAPPPWLADRVVGRIKALAGLALGECLFAQDGHLTFPTPQGPVSIRVSILPSDRGECVVMRLLTVEDEIPTLEELGMGEDDRDRLVRAASAHDGLLVFAGPTGSGKTTTLHALLATVDAQRRNVVSIEDPVEIRSRRIRQVPVRREVGLDFAGILRVVLRQDPDVILVGETRDPETAQLVLQAALAGHLVLTTVHASNALQVFDRFAQLDADRALLAHVTRLAVSQRLLQCICPDCGGEACFLCEGTGLKGRTGVFELLALDSSLEVAVRQGEPPSRLAEVAQDQGFRSLREKARDLVRKGKTTDAEVRRVLEPRGEA